MCKRNQYIIYLSGDFVSFPLYDTVCKVGGWVDRRNPTHSFSFNIHNAPILAVSRPVFRVRFLGAFSFITRI